MSNDQTNLEIFNNDDFGQVRTILINNKIYFVATDIAKILDYKNTNDAIKRHCRGVVKHDTIDSMGRTQIINVIPESDVYRLMARSNMPNSVKFEKWLFEEVVPSIHQKGFYIQKGLTGLDYANMMLELSQQLLKSENKKLELENQNKTLLIENAKQQDIITNNKPKLDYLNKILSSKDCLTVTQIGQDYGLTAYSLNKILQDEGIQYKQSGQWLLKSKHLQEGYVKTETHVVNRGGKDFIYVNTKWTQRGRLFIHSLLKSKGIIPVMDMEYQSRFI